jgi:type IV pilus assembly protein PilV
MRMNLRHRMHGISLLESLVAIALLAGAVLGLLGTQLHLRAAMASTVQRAQAIRLIEDLAERIRTHPEGRPASAASLLAGWGDVVAATDCARAACDADALARADLAGWKRAIGDALAGGQGRVVATDSASAASDPAASLRIAVQVGWRAGGGHAAGPDPSDVAHGPAASPCPSGLACHVAEVRAHVGP